MSQVNALESKGNACVYLDERFASELRVFGVPSEVIAALRTAMAVMSRDRDAMGYGYARWMRQALLEYSLDAMKDQTHCMVERMEFWTGDEADRCKHILKDWSSK